MFIKVIMWPGKVACGPEPVRRAGFRSRYRQAGREARSGYVTRRTAGPAGATGYGR